MGGWATGQSARRRHVHNGSTLLAREMKTRSTLCFLGGLSLLLIIQFPITKMLTQHSEYFGATVTLPYLLGITAVALTTGGAGATPLVVGTIVLYDALILLPTLLRHRMKPKTFWIAQVSTLAITMVLGFMLCPFWED
jgi:hypothetical protein